MKNIAVLWNFTAFHNSVMKLEYGPQWYRKIGNGLQPEAIDVRSIMELARQSGEVVRNVAYGDWQNMNGYATVLRTFDVRLLQFFPQPRGRQDTVSEQLMKDAAALLSSPKNPTSVIVVGGDDRFIGLADVERHEGTELLTISIAAPDNREWENAVDRFTSYRDIARPMQGSGQNFRDPKESHDALISAFLDLRTQYGSDWVRQVKIKPVLLRHLPHFQESEYGYSSFGAYLGDQREVIDRRQLPDAREAEYALLEEVIPSDFSLHEQDEQDPAALVPYYLRIAAQQGVRMPPPQTMWIGIDIYAGFLEGDHAFDSFADLDEECLHQLRQDLPETTLTDAKKVRQVLFKCYLFRPSKDGTIGFHEEVGSLEDIEERYFRLMLARIGNNVRQPVVYTAMSLALTGEEKSAGLLEDLHQEVRQGE